MADELMGGYPCIRGTGIRVIRGWACALPSPPDTLTWAMAAYGVVCLAIAALTIRALLRRDHARALPLVGLSLLVCAVGYAGLAAI